MSLTSSSSSGVVRPTGSSARIEILDVLRGFGLLGLILVNLRYFSWPVLWAGMGERWPGLIDRTTLELIAFFGTGKFYTLFSLLIGVGVMMQADRAAQRQARFWPLHLRRMLTLFAIGAVHGFLLWYGDVLMLYGALGLVLLGFVSRSPKTVLAAALVCLMLPVAFGGVMMLSASEAEPGGPPAVAEEAASPPASPAEQARAAYAQGSAAEIQRQRLRDLRRISQSVVFVWPHVLGTLVLGIYAGKRRVFREAESRLPWVRRLFWWSAAVGLLLTASSEGLKQVIDLRVLSPVVLLQGTCYGLGTPALSVAYASGLFLLWYRRPSFRRWLGLLAPVGRLALSNYLLQTLLCTALFYSWGLGLFGRVGPAAGIVLSLAIFALQVGLSRWWIGRFRFGPIEWLWRALSYGYLPPFRRRSAAGEPAG